MADWDLSYVEELEAAASAERLGITRIHAVEKAAARKLVEEYDKRCWNPEHKKYHRTAGMPEPKHSCFVCWEQLRQEVGLG